jgi:hypothetical protein
MRRLSVLRVVCWVAWAASIAAALSFVRVWLAPDGCLDSGGSFDYGRWECADETKPFVYVPAYALWSFWLLVLSVSLAVGLHGYRRKLTGSTAR